MINERNKAAHIRASERVELTHCLDEVSALADVDRNTCAWLRTKLRDQAFNIVVAGQFNSGKTSVINALLGEALLPVAVVPLTSVVTVIRYATAAAATVSFANGEQRTIAIEAVPDYATEKGNPNNVKKVRSVTVHNPSPWLESGVRLVDTPGIGSVYEHNTDVTQAYLPQADAVLFVASATQPMSRAELDFLKTIRQHANKVLCLLNKIDYLGPLELRESVAFTAHAIHSALGAAVPVFPVSAKQALDSKHAAHADSEDRNGFGALECELQKLLVDEKDEIWLQSAARSLLRMLSQVRLTTELESRALKSPLDEIRKRLANFELKRREALRAREDNTILLEAHLTRLLKDKIEPQLFEFKERQKELLSSSIRQWFTELRALPSKRLRRTLEERTLAAVRAAYDGWLATQEASVAREFDSACATLWSSTQQIIEDTRIQAAAMFSVSCTPIPGESVWRSDSGFYYRFWSEPSSLGLLSSSLVLALPKALGGRLIVRRMQRVATDLLEMQAGRIRYDFEERLKKSLQDFRLLLLERIEATVTGIEAAIERGVELQQRGEAEVDRRQSELARSMRQVAALEARVKKLAGP